MKYAELYCKTNFSFLEGASHADELVTQATSFGYGALAVTDRNTLAGIIRAWGAAKDYGIPLLVGAELHFEDVSPLVVWAANREGYGRLCRLLSIGRQRAEKGRCVLRWNDLVEHSKGLVAGMLPVFTEDRSLTPDDLQPPPPQRRHPAREEKTLAQQARRIKDLFGDDAYLLCQLVSGPDDARALEQLNHLSRRSCLPMVATGGVLYHQPARMIAQDCLTAIRLGVRIDQVSAARPPNSQYHLRSFAELQRTFAGAPDALKRTWEVAEKCGFRIDELRYEYPRELAPAGLTPIEYLKQLVWRGAKGRYPAGVPSRIIELLRHELTLIEDLHYEAYFLTVWDLVRYARERGILCQGRGSAANSVVCYCLGVTSVDPERTDLLFERFISRERNEAPDIDVDFEHQRREEVLQYIYEKYGRDRAGMTATVTCYRTKGALRDVGKALGISSDSLDALSKLTESFGDQERFKQVLTQCGIDPESSVGKRFIYLVDTLRGFPRHLSQHVGGMVMTAGPLCELCPIENASMPGRTVIQWDKDDLDELGILKVDCLSLGMLSAIRRCFQMVEQHTGRRLTLASIPEGDRPTYDMVCRADTVGVFQIESRAQMSMLPRLQPRCYYDLVIEVAIVRPGPIQGQMVHPYLQARKDPSTVQYPSPEIREVLEKTLGVPIFQEQAMRLAVVAAGFTPGEADQLRRAMAAWRRPGVIDQFRIKLLEGMRARGLSETFAEHVFNQIRGFGEYGFPESHAASFALLVYASAYLKCHYPAIFAAALLNSQPMGFYAPAQLVADARKHGVEVLPPDVNASDWDCTIERGSASERGSAGHTTVDRRSMQLRLGLRMVRGLSEIVATRLLEDRQVHGKFFSVEDLTTRVQMDRGSWDRLASADALRSLFGDRRQALWQTLAQEAQPAELPLFAELEAPAELPVSLPPLSELQEVYADYGSTGLSLRQHPMAFCRAELDQLHVAKANELATRRHGQYIRVAGLVLMRQRPGTAKGITFVTLEDETGSMNLILYPAVWQRYFSVARAATAWLASGKLENREGVIHVLVNQLEDLSSHVTGLQSRSRDFH